MNNAVEITSIAKRYGIKRVFDNLSLNFAEGKITGLLGPNGVGKSTLLKMLVGLNKPDSGSIRVFGQEPSFKINSQTAYLPDRAGWYKYQTVNEAISYASIIFHGFDKKTASELLNLMKLDPDMKYTNLSKGQQACLYLIFCLARNVRLLLLDEPFSGIDLTSRERIIQGIIDSVLDRKQTVIISTHEIHESESLFDDVVFLKNGHVALKGNVETLRAKEGSIEEIYRRLYK